MHRVVQGLLSIAAGRGHATLRCDLTAVPLRSSLAAGVICIAALHHLASRERRLAALREMSRLLAPSARLLVYVWARDQGQGKEQSTYLKQNKRNTTEDPEISETGETGEFGLPVHTPRTQFRQQDVLVPWSLQGTQQQYRRYTALHRTACCCSLFHIIRNLINNLKFREYQSIVK